jgi:hypothetical protein
MGDLGGPRRARRRAEPGTRERAVQETAGDHRAEGDRGMQRVVRAVSFGLST